MNMQRVSTGIAGLDTLIQGGFIPSRSYLVTGEAGTGKTTTCMQFLLNGLKKKEKAIYVTVDERPADILQTAASLDWELQSYVQEKRLVILDASAYFSGRPVGGAEHAADLETMLLDLDAYPKRIEATR